MSRAVRTRRVAASLAMATLALAACGGSGDDGSSPAAEPAPVVADAVEIDPAADIATNLMPDLVVDNITEGNKVNVRNYAVGERPTLLWMWAPH